MRLARILHNLEVIVGGYVRGQLITSAAITAADARSVGVDWVFAPVADLDVLPDGRLLYLSFLSGAIFQSLVRNGIVWAVGAKVRFGSCSFMREVGSRTGTVL